jgi:hypothetical protein
MCVASAVRLALIVVARVAALALGFELGAALGPLF